MGRDSASKSKSTEVSQVPHEFIRRRRWDLGAEITHLRTENSQLKADYAVLVEENSDLERRNAELIQEMASLGSALAQARLLLYSMTRTPDYMALPQEILLRIFRFTQPDSSSCSPSIIHGPQSPWLDALRTKKTLALVCKTWSAPATTLLYEEIALRRMGQITALANTLRGDNGSSLAALVQSVKMVACVVWPSCADVVQEDLAYILAQCSNLAAFSSARHLEAPLSHFLDGTMTPGFPRFRRDSYMRPSYNPTWFLDSRPGRVGDCLRERLIRGLRHLSLDLATDEHGRCVEHRYLKPLFHMLSHGTYLTSLIVGRVHDPWDPAFSTSLPELSFPALRNLQIAISERSFYSYVESRWSMPRLENLVIALFELDVLPLLRVHGSRLTYLYFDTMLPSQRHLLPILSKVLPAISHLVLWLGVAELDALNIDSPTLQYLDIFSTEKYPTIELFKTIALAKGAFAPRLQNIRLIGGSCHGWYTSEPNLVACPLLCDPTLLRGDASALQIDDDRIADSTEWTSGGILHRFERDLIRQEWWCLVQQDPRAYGNSPFFDEVDSISSESDSDSDADETSSSGSDSAAEDFDAVYADDEGPFDRDTVLNMFRRGLEGDYLVSDDSSDDSDS
ncbi:hypothetical protein C8T65DRAFT_83126 [Cerioporus squamosus]|nr:hypothetical protein C8T65DRAFT_83126 [Cerioporus squamosus]